MPRHAATGSADNETGSCPPPQQKAERPQEDFIVNVSPHPNSAHADRPELATRRIPNLPKLDRAPQAPLIHHLWSLCFLFKLRPLGIRGLSQFVPARAPAMRVADSAHRMASPDRIRGPVAPISGKERVQVLAVGHVADSTRPKASAPQEPAEARPTSSRVLLDSVVTALEFARPAGARIASNSSCDSSALREIDQNIGVHIVRLGLEYSTRPIVGRFSFSASRAASESEAVSETV